MKRLLFASCLCLLACGDDGDTTDAQVDAPADLATDSAQDLATDTAADAAEDAPEDAEIDATPIGCEGEGDECDVGACGIGRVVCVEGEATCELQELRFQGFLCRPTSGECDIAERCTGASPECPEDTIIEPGDACVIEGSCAIGHFACGSSGEEGECMPSEEPATEGTVCRPSAGLCDAQETCDGVSLECPEDAMMPAGEVCRSSAGLCDLVDTCDGESAECPDELLPQFTFCGAANPANPCDAPDYCKGTSPICANQAMPTGTYCETGRIPTGVCGKGGACQPAAVGDACIAPGSCSLSGIIVTRFRDTSCDPEGRAVLDRLCRPAAGSCDTPEFCTGRAACPRDAQLAEGDLCLDGEEIGMCSSTRGCI